MDRELLKKALRGHFHTAKWVSTANLPAKSWRPALRRLHGRATAIFTAVDAEPDDPSDYDPVTFGK